MYNIFKYSEERGENSKNIFSTGGSKSTLSYPLQDKQIHFLTTPWKKICVQHGKKIYFTRVIQNFEWKIQTEFKYFCQILEALEPIYLRVEFRSEGLKLNNYKKNKVGVWRRIWGSSRK